MRMLLTVNAVFVELSTFSDRRADYLTDRGFAALQDALMEDPAAGDVIPDAGGLRKLRLADARRGKGKRGGLRVIYFWWAVGHQFWLFTLYAKGEVSDLSTSQRRALRELLKMELKGRKTP